MANSSIVELTQSYFDLYNSMVDQSFNMAGLNTELHSSSENVPVEPFEVGSVSTETTEVTEKDIAEFASVSNDYNPLHMDESYSEDGPFGEKIAHGVLCLSIVSSALSRYDGDIIFKELQSVSFTSPVFVGDTITAETTIEEIDGIDATAKFTVYNQDNTEVVSGVALIMDGSELNL